MERRYKLVVFDVDGTLIDELQYIWAMLHDEMGVDTERRKNASEKFYTGQITYRQWAEHDVAMWRESGITKEDIMRCAGKLRPMPGAGRALAELKNRGYRLAIISGGLYVVLKYFFPNADKIFSHIIINRLIFGRDGNVEGIVVPAEFSHAENKAACLKKVAAKEGIGLDECVFVGDSDNDVDVMEAAGLSIGFNPTERLLKACDIVIRKKDMTAVLDYLS